jgi:hypothetical protein
MKKFYAILFLALALVPVNSFAKGGGGGGWLLGVDISYIVSKTEAVYSGTTTSSESSNNIYDISIGNAMGSGVYFGLLYSTKSFKDTDSSSSASAMGPSIGYIGERGFSIVATYILSATDADYKKGTGYQIDLGYRSYLAPNFYMGAKFAMKSVKFTENETLSSSFESLTYNTTIPYLVTGFSF